MNFNAQNVMIIVISTMVVLLIGVGISFYVGRKSSKGDWARAASGLPIYVIIGTQFATAQGGGFLTAHVGNGYSGGWSAVTYGICVALGLWILCAIANWIREQEFGTIPDIMTKLYGENKVLIIITSILTMVVPFGWIIGNLVAFGKLYTEITQIPAWILVIVFSVLALCMVLPGGLKSVAYTDFFFGLAMLVMCFVTLGMLFSFGNGFTALMGKVPEKIKQFPNSMLLFGRGTVLLWIMSIIPGTLTNQMYYQRIFAVKNIKQTKLSLIISGVVIIISEIWASYMGMGIHGLNPNLEPEMAAGWFLTQIPVWFLAIYSGLIAAAIMSTVDSGIQSVSINAVYDIYKKVINNDATEKELETKVKIVSVIVCALAALLAILYPKVLSIIVASYAFSASGLLVPVFVGTLLKDKYTFTAKSIIISMIAGFIVCFIAAVMKTHIPYAIYGLLGSSFGLLIASLFNKNKTSNKIHEI